MGAKAMLFETRFLAAAERVRAELPGSREFIAIGDGRPEWARAYEDVLASAPDSEPEVEIEESDPYYFNLTSGTTGPAQVLSADALQQRVRRADVRGVRADDARRDPDRLPGVRTRRLRLDCSGRHVRRAQCARGLQPRRGPSPDRDRKDHDRQSRSDYGRDDARRPEPSGPRPRVAARAGVRRLDVPGAAAPENGRRRSVRRSTNTTACRRPGR